VTDTVDKLIIQSETRGVTQTTNEVQGLSKAMDGVTVTSQKVERSSGSLESKFAGLERRFGTTAGQASQFERIQKTVNDAVAQNPALQSRANDILAAASGRYAAVAKANEAFAKSSGLARHELINLSRQMQDVGVSLVSGQSPFMVLAQQGSQIADVFATSSGSVRGFFSQLMSMVTPARAALVGLAGAAGGAAYAAYDYSSQQTNVQRSLIGSRSASAAGINQIANDRSSTTGLSVSETREAALEFAKTGQVHSRVIGEMIETTKNFALVTGQSSKEAAAALAGAFTNMQGIDNLNRQFNFLDGNTRRVIEGLLLAGRTTEAAALANERLRTSLKEVEDTQGGLAKGWTAVANSISNAADKVGEYIAKAAGLQKTSKSERASELESEIARLEKMNSGVLGGFTSRLNTAQLTKYKEELNGIQLEMNELAQQKAFNALSVGAIRAVASMDPLRGKLDEIVGRLTRLKDAKDAGVNVPGLQMALTYYTQIAEQIQRQMQAQDALLAKYPGMTSEFAKQVDSLKDQNDLLKARQNGTEATVSAAIAYKNAIAAGANETEAAAIQALTLKNNMLQAADAAQQISSAQLGAGMHIVGAAMTMAPGVPDENSGSYLNPTPGGASFFSEPSTMGQGGSSRSEFFIPARAQTNMQAWWTDPELIGGIFKGIKGPDLDELRRQDEARRNAERSGQIQYLSGGTREEKISAMEMEIAELGLGLAENPGNFWQIKSLERELEKLRNSVDENTEALNKVTLNPLYNGRDALRVGYMGAASGLDMMVKGGIPGVDSVPIHIMAQQGERVQVTRPGESAATNDNSKTVVVNNTISVVETKTTSRRNSRQLGQKYGQLMASLS
jgi:hypothetical protein